MSGTLQALADGATGCTTHASAASGLAGDGWIAFAVLGIVLLIKHNHHHDKGEIRLSKHKSLAILGSRKAAIVYALGFTALLTAQFLSHGGVSGIMPTL